MQPREKGHAEERGEKKLAENEGPTNDASHCGVKGVILVLKCVAHQLISGITTL
jgi:hypothetical protein